MKTLFDKFVAGKGTFNPARLMSGPERGLRGYAPADAASSS